MAITSNILEKLRIQFQSPLPGDEIRYRMSPPYRPNLTVSQVLEMKPRYSGVLLLLYEKSGELNMVLTQRKNYPGIHSGQMSFPGGKQEEQDHDLTATALRETQEEIGIEKEKIEIIGKLSDVYIPPSNFWVTPLVGFSNAPLQFSPQTEEVEEIVEIPVHFFRDERCINMNAEIKLFNGNLVHSPAYIYNGRIIWGATAIMLCEFMFMVEQALKKE